MGFMACEIPNHETPEKKKNWIYRGDAEDAEVVIAVVSFSLRCLPSIIAKRKTDDLPG